MSPAIPVLAIPVLAIPVLAIPVLAIPVLAIPVPAGLPPAVLALIARASVPAGCPARHALPSSRHRPCATPPRPAQRRTRPCVSGLRP